MVKKKISCHAGLDPASLRFRPASPQTPSQGGLGGRNDKIIVSSVCGMGDSGSFFRQ
ncbi:MAG: hypothetical protein UV63_C0057G0005 [Microgenomates group bacterium GW2011_GWC1_43_11]|nr:MAG: hypothetical protein UV63_C0057G0005 [Microgenomates group bacterium GW2011_GWC1_43_11]